MHRGSSSVWPLAVLLSGWLFTGVTQSAPLQGSEWKPLRISGTAIPEESDAFVQFRSKGRLEGHSGCNRIFAEYQVDDSYIFIGPVAATRMACAESLMVIEAALAGALENARTYRRERRKLMMFDRDGSPILEMRQADWD